MITSNERARGPKAVLHILAIRVSTVILLCLLTGAAPAQVATPTLTIMPPRPTQSDTLHIAVATNRACYPLTGQSMTAGAVGSSPNITIQIRATLTCSTVPGDSRPVFGFDVPAPSPGIYPVQYWASFDGGVPTLLATSSVEVFSAVIPDPAYAGQILHMTKIVPGASCYDTLQVRNVITSGNVVTVDYSVQAKPTPSLCGLSPPMVLYVPIGPIPTPGEYVVIANGDYRGTRNPTIREPFTILPPPSPLKSYQGLWWSAPAGSESGWGINFAHQGDIIFATWFTYDLAGKPWWLSMTANKTSDGRYSGDIIETHGPPFDSVPYPAMGTPGGAIPVVVGSGTLAFAEMNNATFTYAVNGVQQSRPITRQVFGTLPDCTFWPTFDAVQANNLTDLWWASPAASEAGWGLNIAQETAANGTAVLFVTWFTYDRNRAPLWLTGTATFDNATGVYKGDLYQTNGPPFNALPFPSIGSPGGAIGSVVGTSSFKIYSDGTMMFSYALDGVTQTKALERQTFASPRAVCQYVGPP